MMFTKVVTLFKWLWRASFLVAAATLIAGFAAPHVFAAGKQMQADLLFVFGTMALPTATAMMVLSGILSLIHDAYELRNARRFDASQDDH